MGELGGCAARVRLRTESPSTRMSASSNWGRCGHYDLAGNWVQQYSGQLDDPAYQRDELHWEAATYRHMHNYSKTATMQVNMPYEFGYSEPM